MHHYGCWFVGHNDLAVALHDLYLQFPPPLRHAAVEETRHGSGRSKVLSADRQSVGLVKAA